MRCFLLLFVVALGTTSILYSANHQLPYHKTKAAIETRSGEIIWVLKIAKQNREKIYFIDVTGARMTIARKYIKKLHIGTALQRLKYQRHRKLLAQRKQKMKPVTKEDLFATLPFISLNRRCRYDDPREMKEFFGMEKHDVEAKTVSGGGMKGLQLRESWDFQYELVDDFKFWVRGPKLNVLTIMVGGETVTVGRPDIDNEEFEVSRKDGEVVIWSQLHRRKLWSGKIPDREITIAIASSSVAKQYLPAKKTGRRRQYWDHHKGRMVTQQIDERGRVIDDGSGKRKPAPSVYVGGSYCPVIKEVHVWGKMDNPNYQKSESETGTKAKKQ